MTSVVSTQIKEQAKKPVAIPHAKHSLLMQVVRHTKYVSLVQRMHQGEILLPAGEPSRVVRCQVHNVYLDFVFIWYYIDQERC